jgi:hypothetical protein
MGEKFSPEIEEELKKRALAEDHWHQNGRLGVTANDHNLIGGTPPGELTKNPGKTLGEIWPLEKIEESLKALVEALDNNMQKLKKSGNDYLARKNAEDGIKYYKKELRLAIPYLKSINKLPPAFEGIAFEDLPNDPK